MTNAKQAMFSDRRKRADRRTQNLSMPAGQDRRVRNRRSKHFQSQPWWLQISYASELISEDKTNEEVSDDNAFPENKPLSEKSD